MPSPNALRELRFTVGTTFNDTHLNAANGSWDVGGDVTKLRVVGWDDSGLVQEGIPDETLQTRLRGRPAPYAGLRKGSLKFSTYLGSAESDIENNPEATLLHAMMGGIQGPTNARSTSATAGTMSTVNVAVDSANTYCVPGMAVLVGSKGDSRGNGEVKIVDSVDDGGITFKTACSGAPADGDPLVISTTVYLDETADQRYLDTLSIGHGTADQRQTCGGAAVFTIGGTGTGELPKLEVDLMVADHRWVPDTDLATRSHAVPTGNEPPFSRGIGMLEIGNNGVTERNVFRGGEISITPGLALEEHPDLGGVNGVGGFQRMPGSARVEATVLIDEDDGAVEEFEDRNNKTVLVQFGHEAEGCCAVELQKAHFTDLPSRATLNNLAAWKVTLEADEEYTAGNELLSSALRIHYF